MMLPVITALCLLVLPARAQPEPQPEADAKTKEELKKLQGSWEIEHQELDGKKLAASDLKGRTICFGKAFFLVRQNTSMIQLGKLKFDPSKSPKTVNAMIEKGKQEGDIFPGIYELDGDTLKICFNTEGDERPKEFKTGPKSGLTLMVCKRIKVKAEEGDLTGEYRSESFDITGRKILYDASIERVGDAYLIAYKVGGKLVYMGVGIRKGKIFAIGWLSQGQVGISIYEIEKGNRLVGQFEGLGGPGFLGTEILTRVLKEV
jgi:uncharacterized protein (TIGR03067 family)